MKILVVGKGGREHAIIWKLSQSPKVDKIYCAPGNGGISALAECIPVSPTDIQGMVKAAKEIKPDMVMVAPDDPLVAGMVDVLEDEGFRVFGPRKNAAILEGSKSFSKDLMKKYGIPTAGYEVFENREEALAYLAAGKYPAVIKADGLALGKGVIIAETYQEAEEAVNSMMLDKVFGDAGRRIVVEEFIKGPEVSVLAFTDGHAVVPMVSAQDHKRAQDGDKGLNTGGMGTFSPSRVYTDEIADFCMKMIYKPTVEAMEKEGRIFRGVLFFGLMLTEDGPKVLEYNARFGDPETQVVLPRLKTDLADIFEAVIDGRLHELEVQWHDNAAVCVVMASGGYPEKYATGYEITGLDGVQKNGDIVVFHAGTRQGGDCYLTDGGRVLGVTAMAGTLDEAIRKSYEGVSHIHFKDAHYRKDIGVK